MAAREATKRRNRGSRPAALAIALLMSTAPAFAEAPPSPLADSSSDHSVAATWVPDPSRKVGEVRLVTRGDAVVVQTLLDTKLLARVLAEIRSKEEKNWTAGDASARAYLAALDEVHEILDRRGEGSDDRRRRLLIEFVANASDAAVLVGTFTPGADDKTLAPREREVLRTLTPPRAYVLRNMRLILADSFKVDEKDVDSLGPLGPAAGSTGQGSPPAGSAPPAAPGQVPPK